MRRRVPTVALCLALLVGCGGDDGGQPVSTGGEPGTDAPSDSTSTNTAAEPDTTGADEVSPWSIPDVPALPTISPTGPACGPGQRIAFERRTEDPDAPYGARVDVAVVVGDGPEPITLFDAAQLSFDTLGQPDWSPDGTRLVMYADMSRFVIGTCDGQIERELPEMQTPTASGFGVPITQASYPSWSPDGRWLAFVSPEGLFVVDATGSMPPVLRYRALDLVPSPPAWTPDGARLVVAGSDPANPDTPDLVVVPLAGGSVARLTDTPDMWELQPAVSPDGSTLAYRSEQDDVGGIWLMDVDGTNLRRLTPEGIDAYQPTWSPDGTQVAFVEQVGDGDLRIRSVGLDGSPPRPLTPDDEPVHVDMWPTWTQ